MREYNDSDVMYVYDRICSKKNKDRQLLREYRMNSRTAESTPRTSPGLYGREFIEKQKARAAEYRRAEGERSSRNNRPRANYSYRSENIGRNGAEAVKQKPLKLIIEHIVDMFDSIEERGIRDEETAKKLAIARKKFYEYRHAILTVLIMLVAAFTFVYITYETFFVISETEVNGVESYTTTEVLSAAGIEIGDNLYSFKAGYAEDMITFVCPKIKSARIERTMPDTVTISTVEDKAVFYTDVYGDLLELSSGLRVVGTTTEENAQADGLIKLVLPAVEYSVAGRVITFNEARNERYIREVIKAVDSSSFVKDKRVRSVDLSREYDITINCDDMYLLCIGTDRDCELKLKMAYKTMNDERFDKIMPAVIDISKTGEASVRYDMNLKVN